MSEQYDYLDQYAGEGTFVDPEHTIAPKTTKENVAHPEPEEQQPPRQERRSDTTNGARAPPLVTDADAALSFLRAMRREGPWVLTAIVPDGATITRTFEASDEIGVRKFIETNNATKNIYFTGNPCGRPIKKPTKADMTGAIFLHTDDDPRQNETPVAAKVRILAGYDAHDPPPSVVIDSGNGLQGIWLLESEYQFQENKQVEEIELRNRALAARLGTAPGTHNVDRLLRLPGTINHPNKAKRKKGRVDCMASIMRITDARYALASFEKADDSKQKAETEAKPSADSLGPIEPDDPRMKALGPDWIEVGTRGTGPQGIREKHKGDRSDAVLAFACECVRHDILDEVIASCLIHWKIGEHVREQPNMQRALARTIAHARGFVADSMLFKMNQKHCVLPIGGKTRVVTWGEDPEFPGHRTIIMTSSMADFKSLHDKYRHSYVDAAGEPKLAKRGGWWIANPARRQYDGGMRFDPHSEEDLINGDTLNLWEGFGVAARRPEGKSGASGCQRFLDHCRKVICSGNEEHYDYLIKREALIVQKRVRTEIAVALQTEIEGTGKGIHTRTFNRLFGVHAMQVQNPEHVVGKHNPHLEKLIRFTADESLFARNPEHRNSLYSLITEPDLTIEPKFVNPYKATNYLNIDVISNAKHFIPVSNYARRFFVPTVSVERVNDRKYFDDVLGQLADGGHEALLYHLLHEVDVRDFDVRAVPKTAALAEQAAYSRHGVDLLVEKVCNDAVAPCAYHAASFSVSSGHESREGLDYFIDHHTDRELARLGALKVKRALVKDWGCVTGKAAKAGSRVSGVAWPSLADLRQRFIQKHGPQEWLVDAEEWLTDF